MSRLGSLFSCAADIVHFAAAVHLSRMTLYTAGQLAHSPATKIHTVVLIVLPGHGCVNNGGTAVWTMGHGCVQVPGCVEGHPCLFHRLLMGDFMENFIFIHSCRILITIGWNRKVLCISYKDDVQCCIDQHMTTDCSRDCLPTHHVTNSFLGKGHPEKLLETRARHQMTYCTQEANLDMESSKSKDNFL